MRQYFANNPIEQVPQIPGKRGFYAKSLLQLPCKRFYQPAFTSQGTNCFYGQGRISSLISSDRGMKIEVLLLPESCLQRFRPIASVAKKPDIHEDGIVDMLDSATMTANWLEFTFP